MFAGIDFITDIRESEFFLVLFVGTMALTFPLIVVYDHSMLIVHIYIGVARMTVKGKK